MASNLVAMAFLVAIVLNPVAMAFNLVLQPSSDGLQPSSDGDACSDGLKPICEPLVEVQIYTPSQTTSRALAKRGFGGNQAYHCARVV